MKKWTIFLTLAVNQTFAANWSQIHTFKNGAKVYSAESYLLADGTVRTFLKITKGKISGDPFAILINCENRLIRNYVAGDFGSEYFIPWEPITPDSVGEVAANSFCKKVLRKKEEMAQDQSRQEKIENENNLLIQAELQANGYSLVSNSNGYIGRLRARVRPNITFSELQLQAVKGNPETVIEVVCKSSGKIIGKKLIRTSGNLAWDEAVLNAIDKTESLPRDENGNIPSKVSIGFRPRD
jgi:hypothetical protein